MTHPKRHPTSDDQEAPVDADDVLRRMLNTPPRPHKPPKGEGERKRKKGKR